MAEIIGYKQLPNHKRQIEVDRFSYGSLVEAQISAEGLTTLQYYDTIEVEDEHGIVTDRWVYDSRSALYQRGF